MTISQSIDSVFLPAIEEFLGIFNHRYDYIYSARGIQPQWKTEKRHPLHNNLIKQASEIYGVRFGSTTNYAMLDIDAGSPYHPRTDKLAIPKMLAALEPLGIVASCTVSSSYSQGLHVYLPLGNNFTTWEIASAIDALITAAGFSIFKGWLEIFPNVRTAPDQLYMAHRLPMQSGSYVLGQDYDRIGHSHWDFVSSWRWATSRNDCTEKKLANVLKFYRRTKYSITKKGAKFLQDLDAEIELGWTGHHQTNVILGRIAMRGRVFGHLLEGTENPLTLRQLINYTTATAKSLPGYEEFCRHQHELERKAEMWCRSAMAKYWPYAIGPDQSAAGEGEDLRSSNPWNQLQRELARDKISFAMLDLVRRDELPEGERVVLERAQALYSYGISGQTLYQHPELWHPDCGVTSETVRSRWVAAGGSEDLKSGGPGSEHPQDPKLGASSLLPKEGCDLPLGKDLKRSDQRKTPKEGCDHNPGRRFTPNT